MSDLLSSLSIAARALDAQTFGLDVTGQNISNVNTPGYVRRTVNFQAVPSGNPQNAGGGVDVAGLIAQRAPLIDARLRQEQPLASRDGAIADALSVVGGIIGQAGTSGDAALSSFYASFSQLAQDPTSGSARQQVVVQGQSLAQTFGSIASRLTSAQTDADTQVKSTVDQVNALAAQIGALNTSIGNTTGPDADTLRDHQTQLLSQLSSLVDISVVPRDSGGADVSIGNGRPLVVADNVYQLSATATPPQGLAAIKSGSTTITSEITGGTLGGLLHVRDVLIPTYSSQLDQIAYGVVTDVNAAHQAGFDLSGTAGQAFFTPLASAAGAASSMAVNAAVAANPNLVAASGTGTSGDNQAARAIANLQTQTMTGGTANPIDSWGNLAYRVGTDAQTAINDKANRAAIVNQLQTLRDQVSGVSLDEEAAMMMKYQRAYEANARYFTLINQTLDTLIQTVS